jgi:hypothetical protein
VVNVLSAASVTSPPVTSSEYPTSVNSTAGNALVATVESEYVAIGLVGPVGSPQAATSATSSDATKAHPLAIAGRIAILLM